MLVIRAIKSFNKNPRWLYEMLIDPFCSLAWF